MKTNPVNRPAGRSFALMLTTSIVLGLATTSHSATNIVTSLADSGSGSLRQAIAEAVSGDAIVFAVSGTINLTGGALGIDKNVSILGPGAPTLAISGKLTSRLFTVSTNVTVLISGVTLRDGQAPAGIGGTASSSGGPGGPGGAISNAGSLTIWNCVLTNNHAGVGGDGYNLGGNVGAGTGGVGGAIYSSGVLSASNLVIAGNLAGRGGFGGWPGGSGEAGGDGGAIYGSGPVWLVNCSVTGNSCGYGGAEAQISSDVFGRGGSGGDGGSGGGIYATNELVLVGCTLRSNLAGSGGVGANSMGYEAGYGGPGGAGAGAFIAGSLRMTNCTATDNQAGNGGGGGSSIHGAAPGGNGGSGGGLYCASAVGVIAVVSCTIVSNSFGLGGSSGTGYRGPPAPNGSGTGIYLSSPVVQGGFLDNIVSAGIGRTQDVAGAFNSLGHNLIGATNGSSGFTAVGDLVGSAAAPLDPLVGPLADNGGPTLTMALLPGSPAIGTGAALGAPTTDQRGVLRPLGGAAIDIGAFEFTPGVPALSISSFSVSGIQLRGVGQPTQSCRLLASYDLATWIPVATNQFGLDGTVLFPQPRDAAALCRFYRLAMP
jgi:hypothetical protein